jgi:acyl-CoA reductase-like NAD-dependent aldehyde dehydrogenase
MSVAITFPSGLLIDGAWRDSDAKIMVEDKYHGTPFATVSRASRADVDSAVAAAAATAQRTPLSPVRRYEIIAAAARILANWQREVVATYVAETGFTVRDAETELTRTAETLLLSAEEAKRLTGEVVPVAAAPGSENRLAFTLRIPVGVVAAIAPFNAPLNTVAHKVGPALAAGNGVVLKPSTATPFCSAWFCQAFLEAGLPDGYLNMVVGPGSEVGDQLVSDHRIRYFTFTGSSQVGLWIKQRSGIAKTHLELGSSSATIVCADADLDLAADLITRAGFRKAGQVCTSAQRIIVERPVADDLAERLQQRIARLRVGDPSSRETDVGPMIATVEAERAATWVGEAVGMGAALLGGGERERNLLHPSLLVRTPAQARVMRDEVFAPIVALTPFETLPDAVAIANSTRFGLQAGVFTRDIDRAFALAGQLEVGGVMINDTSSYHADLMPYGGVKESGYGVEGPIYAVQDMTDPRIIVLNLQGAH